MRAGEHFGPADRSFHMHRPGRHITLSFFRYAGRERVWGMRQMAEMRRPLQAVPGLGFFKLLGTGGGFWPDLGTYGLLGAWESRAHADAFHASHPVHRSFLEHGQEVYTLYLAPLMSRGSWSGSNPFIADGAVDKGPLAVLTLPPSRHDS